MNTDERERRAWLMSLHDPDCFYVTHNGACDCLDGVVAERAAAAMRDKCVEKVKTYLQEYSAELQKIDSDDDPEYKASVSCAIGALEKVITALESLTSDQVEEKQ